MDLRDDDGEPFRTPEQVLAWCERHSTGKRYNSVEELIRDTIEGDARHMALELIARDQGMSNPDTDQRVDLTCLQSIKSDAPDS